MRNTRENVCKLLKARVENLRGCARATTNIEAVKRYRAEAMGLESALEYLTDNKYFNDIAAIFLD